MRRWELWTSETSQSFFPEENDGARRMAEEDGEVFTWEVVAGSINEAMRAMYSYRGWGAYKPMLRDDGTPHPEHEDDDYVPPEA
jgi:hypothetical protein